MTPHRPGMRRGLLTGVWFEPYAALSSDASPINADEALAYARQCDIAGATSRRHSFRIAWRHTRDVLCAAAISLSSQ